MTLGGFIKVSLTTGACIVLVACQDEQATVVETIPDNDKCVASEFAKFIGQSEDVLTTVDLPKRHRIIQPNSAVTADYIETRVNFLIDKSGLIEDVKCY